MYMVLLSVVRSCLLPSEYTAVTWIVVLVGTPMKFAVLLGRASTGEGKLMMISDGRGIVTTTRPRPVAMGSVPH